MGTGDLSFPDLLKRAVRDGTARMHTTCPAIVESYDPDNQTVSARLILRSRFKDGNGDIQSVPGVTVVNVPVMFPHSKGGFGLTFPLQRNDYVTLHFSDRSISEWRSTGNDDITAGDLRRFSVSDAFAYPGGQPPSVPIGTSGQSATAMVIEGSEILMGSSLATDFIALASLVKARIDKIQSDYDVHTHVESGATTAPPIPLIGTLAGVAATKVKAE